jgi:hypothetical protein
VFFSRGRRRMVTFCHREPVYRSSSFSHNVISCLPLEIGMVVAIGLIEGLNSHSQINTRQRSICNIETASATLALVRCPGKMIALGFLVAVPDQ